MRVTAGRLSAYTKIEVADTGRGIPESHQAAIFKRFYREPEVHKTEGIGLGLYLTREIIKNRPEVSKSPLRRVRVLSLPSFFQMKIEVHLLIFFGKWRHFRDLCVLS
ncbi:MAG: sensor histidine kinase [Faecalicatena sp.]|uniref:sensor histidine kinase n=1 Tax=Faecalicatena sp. TaxID=2005360 RepID=UPI002590C253|nr:sensor histidine kinase [Faecalicatena sp.]MCI6464330.1 sensor histidine kinase [Faecalicatena sp.]MDY5621304.1 sensor histidine kinase [Lachnospiraceae bacterium]